MGINMLSLGKRRPIKCHLNLQLWLRGVATLVSTIHSVLLKKNCKLLVQLLKTFKSSMPSGCILKFQTGFKHFLAKILSFSEACQNSPRFMLTHQTHLQECQIVHMWHVHNLWQKFLNGFDTIHLWCRSMMLNSLVCTMDDHRIAGVSRTIAKQISTCPWPPGLQGTLYFLHCAVTISCIILGLHTVLQPKERQGNGYIYTHIYYIYIYIHMYMPTVHQRCWKQLMPQNAACMHAEVYSWPFICIDWC